MSKTVILTGLRANEDLHIGNYFGALLPIVDIATQKGGQFQVNLFVPDLHSFTTPIDHTKLQAQILHNLRIFTAAGLPIDNPDVHIYRQSFIPAHSELTWILDCFTGMGEMGRMTQFKDKSAKLGADRVSVGLFNYPVLMAADILLYGASYVPVGDDQTQHIEFTRDIAERLNKQFGEMVTMPKPVEEQHEFFGKDQGLRIKDLQEPVKKMSKSAEADKGVIFLTDQPADARQKVMAAETDSVAKVQYSPAQPGISNLLEILKLLGGDPDQFSGQGQYGPLKTAVADLIADFLEAFQSKLSNVDDNAILRKLEDSEKLMNEQAGITLQRIQKAVGLRP